MKAEDNNKKKVEKTKKRKSFSNIIVENSLIIMALLIGVGMILGYGWYSSANKPFDGIGEKTAEQKVLTIVAENMVQPGTEVDVKDISIELDMYKMNLDVGGQEATVYLSKDGEVFFPNVVQLADLEKNQGQNGAAANVEVPKKEKPTVEAFVMSYCPFGTQIQKGLLPVIEALGDTIDFEFKYVDYAMHEKEEIEENVRQYCISTGQQTKYLDYLKCFLAKEDASAECLASEGINTSKLAACASDVDKKFDVSKNLEDQDSWGGPYPPFDLHKIENEKYGVQGSPTLVINGVTVPSAQRDPASLQASICNAFSEKPQECEIKLADKSPTPGFGEGEAASAASGSCN